jgi:hypothetical protein
MICPTNCNSCSSNISCQTCIANSYLFNANCISCPTGQVNPGPNVLS